MYKLYDTTYKPPLIFKNTGGLKYKEANSNENDESDEDFDEEEYDLGPHISIRMKTPKLKISSSIIYSNISKMISFCKITSNKTFDENTLNFIITLLEEYKVYFTQKQIYSLYMKALEFSVYPILLRLIPFISQENMKCYIVLPPKVIEKNKDFKSYLPVLKDNYMYSLDHNLFQKVLKENTSYFI